MKSILIADDEEILRMLITDTIEDFGYVVDEAEDGVAALQKLETGNYDLVILDYMMPQMTGIEVLEKLSAERKEKLEVLMLTAKTQEKDKEKMRAAGAGHMMSKPFSPIELMGYVKEIIG
ncbi:response regulator [Aciduricibacillus chroicocephali]|uniref:Response regulator n=1 Tax=Aciduricibacillus chroicocephali TaxID=3054939 RepID=A0ABY9KWG7_9BACI|nr:response regulator [Bacillaceae bacterium 44XB]